MQYVTTLKMLFNIKVGNHRVIIKKKNGQEKKP